MISQTNRSEQLTPAVDLTHLDGRPERALIGSLMLNREQWPLVAAMLSPESFREPECGLAWQSIRELVDAGEPVDTLTVADKMAAIRGDDSGLGIWCLEVLETVPHGAHAPEYARMVHDSWMRRQIANLVAAAIRGVKDPHEQVADTLAELEGAIRELSEGASLAPAQPIGETILATLDEIGVGTRKRTPTGFAGLDGLIGGFRPGQLVVIGARPGMGKSALALNLCDNIATAGTPCGYITLEMSRQELQERLLARRARVRIEAMECPSPATKHALAEAAQKIHRLPLILDQSSRALEAVVSSIRWMRRRHGVEMVVVDYIGLVRPPDVRAPREQQIAVITRRLKELAVEQQIAVLACAQLNRGLESRLSKVPQLSDLRESGAIEQDADIVLFVHRPGKYDSEVPDDVAQIIVAKQRQGGTGRVDLGWRGALTTFTERPGPFGD